MNDKELDHILGRCLDQIISGKTVSACLAEHPEHAAELAPLLAMAAELGTLRDFRLSDTARQRTRMRLLRAEAARNEQRGARGWQPGAFAVSRLASGLIVVMLCVLVTTGVVAASRPGDLAYGVRVAMERAPAWLTMDSDSRARAELGIAARRLADLDRTMSSQEQRLDRRTVAALLASAEQAAALAASLPEAEQAQVSARLAEQARRIAQIGQNARSAQDGAALQAAAGRVQRAAEQAGAATPPDGDAPAAPGAGLTRTPPQGNRHTPTAERTPEPGSSVTRQPTSRPVHMATSVGPGPGTTALHTGPAATLASPGPSATPQGPSPSATAPGQVATPLGPGPNATAPGPGPSPTPPGPGPNATAPGSASDATPEGPGPDQTSPDPGSGSDPGEGHGSGH